MDSDLLNFTEFFKMRTKKARYLKKSAYHGKECHEFATKQSNFYILKESKCPCKIGDNVCQLYLR